MNDDTYVNLSQAVEQTGVSRRTLYNWMKHDHVQHKRSAVAGQLVRIGDVRAMVGTKMKAEAARRRAARAKVTDDGCSTEGDLRSAGVPDQRNSPDAEDERRETETR